jgi:hypothetical protein
MARVFDSDQSFPTGASSPRTISRKNAFLQYSPQSAEPHHARSRNKNHGLAFSVMGPVGGGHEDFVVHCGRVRSHSLHRKTR